MIVLEAARAQLRNLRFGLLQCAAATIGTATRNRLRRARQLAGDRRQRALRRCQIGVDPAHFGARVLQPAGDRSRSADQLGMLGLELGSPRLGFFQFLGALVQLLVEQRDRIAHFAARALDIGLAEDLEHLDHDVLRELGVLGIGVIATAHGRGDFEQVVFLAAHLDPLGKAPNRVFHVAGGAHVLAQFGRFDHFAQRRCTGDALLDPRDIGHVAARNADLFGQHIVQLDEDLRMAFIGVGDRGDEQPAR